jgi:tRNA(fMet)-specific endonuclease VapC
MLHAMLDTNVCVRALRDKPKGFRGRFRDETGTLAISTIVLFELHHGVAKSQQPELHRKELDEFIARLIILKFDNEAAEHAGHIKADLERKGKIIGPNDLLIAGHARSLSLKLVTGNLREFTRVDGLICEDWLA